MPYTVNERRSILMDSMMPLNEGELNYIITKVVLDYLKMCETRDGRKSYSPYNSAIGVLECAKLELYRRAVSLYEDSKIQENGDVY